MVGLSAIGVPPGVSSLFTPSTGTAGFVAVFLLNTPGSFKPGTYQINVVGTSGELVHSSSFDLTIVAAPPATFKEIVSNSPQQGGTTDPASGSFTFLANRLLNITAFPSSGWSLDHWLVNGISAGNGSQLSFVPKGDVTINAVFIKATPPVVPSASVSFSAMGANSSEVVVDGARYALPRSFTWPIGSSHQVSVQTVIRVGNETELVLLGWHGWANSSSSALSVTVKNSMTLIADYQTKLLVNFAFVDSVATPVTPQNATISGPGGWITITSANSSAWLDAGGEYTFVAATAGGIVVSHLPVFGGFTVNNPATITVPLSIFPISIRVVDVFGQSISGAKVTLTTPGQQRFTQITGNDGVATFNDIPNGWFNATYSYLGVSGSLSNSATGAHSNTVTMALSYPIFSVVAVFAAAAAIASVRIWRRNRAVDRAVDGQSI